MNTLQILGALKNIPVESKGVYPSDRIPRLWSRPAGLVFNTDDHTKPGSHWVGIYVDKHGRGCYMDSFGLPPLIKSHVSAIKRNCKFIEWNDRQLQSETSNFCGHYIIMFLHFMSAGFDYNLFLSLFGTSSDENDRIVKEYYETYVDKNCNGICTQCLQTCCSKL